MSGDRTCRSGSIGRSCSTMRSNATTCCWRFWWGGAAKESLTSWVRSRVGYTCLYIAVWRTPAGVIGRRSGISRTRSRESPKRSRESDSIEDPLVLFAGVRTPIGREPIVPPGVGQLAQSQHGDSRSWSAITKPSGNVLFRPEEIHVASSKNDVFPPRACRDQAMEAHRLIVGSLASDRYR